MQDYQKPVSPSIGVIIPVFNSGREALGAIRSVMDQVHIRATEIVVVDDGSVDGSATIIRDACKDYPIPVRIFSVPNGGAANARSHGMSQCQCDFYAFLDSDDTWLPNKLHRQMPQFANAEQVGMVGSLTTMGLRGAAASTASGDIAPISLKQQLFKNHFQTSTVVVRRRVVEQIGMFPRDQRHAEEGDFFNRIAAKYTCLLLKEVLVNYDNGKQGFGSSGLSANLLAMEKGELRNIRRAYLRGDCGIATCAAATAYSLLKFGRRVLISSMRKLSKSA